MGMHCFLSSKTKMSMFDTKASHDPCRWVMKLKALVSPWFQEPNNLTPHDTLKWSHRDTPSPANTERNKGDEQGKKGGKRRMRKEAALLEQKIQMWWQGSTCSVTSMAFLNAYLHSIWIATNCFLNVGQNSTPTFFSVSCQSVQWWCLCLSFGTWRF